MNLSPIQKLDLILEILNHNNGVTSLLEISNGVKNEIPHEEIDILLLKLSKDDYIEKPYGDGNPIVKTYYRLTLDGQIFYQNGGYKQEKKIAKIRLLKDEVYTYSVAVGTLLAGLYALFEILKWFANHFHLHLPF